MSRSYFLSPSSSVIKEEEDEDSADEVFEDAAASISIPKPSSNLEESSSNLESVFTNVEPNFEQSVELVYGLLQIALGNRFREAVQECEKWCHCSLYHCLGKANLGFIKGILTLEKKETTEAMEGLKALVAICQTKRKNISSLSRMVWKPNYDTFTDEEVHAELVYAEALLMISLMTFLGDQNLINLVKGAFRIRSSFQVYKECNYILSSKSNWNSNSSRRHFESGVRMGIGTFNIMISHMPSKILRVLEVLGFSGNRSQGFAELELATLMTDGLRSPIALLIAMTYHCYVEHYFGVGDGDIGYVKGALETALRKFPDGAFFLLFAGRVSQLQGDMETALGHFQRCISIQNEWRQFHNLCYWESLWCHALQCDWKQAAKFANILRQQCNWSPATYTYQYATFLYMEYEESGCSNLDLKKEIEDVLRSVPGLRIRYAGKTVPCEKFAIVKSEKYFNEPSEGDNVQNNDSGTLLMPALEFIYIWNMFAIMDKKPILAQKILDIVEVNLPKYQNLDENIEDEVVEGQSFPPVDKLALCLLLKGMSLRTLGFPLQAQDCFLRIIRCEKRLVTDTYIAPHAAYELGLTYMRCEEYVKARSWLEKARHEYTGYLLETLIHFRVHCALRTIKTREIGSSNVSTCSEIGQEPEIEPSKLIPSPSSKSIPNSSSGKSIPDSNPTFTELARQYQLERDGKGDEGPNSLLLGL